MQARVLAIQDRLLQISDANAKLAQEKAALMGELETLEGKATEADTVYFEINHNMRTKPPGYPKETRELIDALAKMKSVVSNSRDRSRLENEDLTARFYPNNSDKVSFSISSTTGKVLTDLFYGSIKDLKTQSLVKDHFEEFPTKKTIVTFTFNKSELNQLVEAVNLLLDSQALTNSDSGNRSDSRRAMLC